MALKQLSPISYEIFRNSFPSAIFPGVKKQGVVRDGSYNSILSLLFASRPKKNTTTLKSLEFSSRNSSCYATLPFW